LWLDDAQLKVGPSAIWSNDLPDCLITVKHCYLYTAASYQLLTVKYTTRTVFSFQVWNIANENLVIAP
jgi:hypothetical protein